MSSIKSINLPWHQSQSYWMCVLPKQNGEIPVALGQALVKVGMNPQKLGECQGYCMTVPRKWGGQWQAVYRILESAQALTSIDAVVLASDLTPDDTQISVFRRSAGAIQKMSENLWLGEALLEDRLLCYLQPVVNLQGKVFGYESFARVKGEDGAVIGGAAIVEACRALEMEYALDRQLHIEAIKTFVTSEFSGSLFINFFPGFIQRPEKYLSGLSEMVQEYGIVARNIVLDVTQSEASIDLQHIRRVAEYCRSKGYALALDDIESAENAAELVNAIQPNFVKLDYVLVNEVANGRIREEIRRIIEHSKSKGALVIAEGVENEETFNYLKELNVDLFQGYYFSAPVPVEEITSRGQASA